MSEENKSGEELDELTAQAEETVEEVAEVAQDAEEVVEGAADAELELAEDAAETVGSVDERVEAAVRNVAEEAASEEAAAEKVVEEAKPERKKRERRSKQARSAKDAWQETADPEAKKAKASGLAALGTSTWIAISVAALALGLVLGRFVLGGGAAGGAADLSGKTTVTEAELDNTYATYTYNGQSHGVTVREVIEQTGTVEDAADADGNYKLPSAENAINAARNAILNAEIESRGIEVSDEDVAAYAEKALGTSDFEAIGSAYGMDADAVKQLITENCKLEALRDEVVEAKLPDMPEAPEAAEEGKEDEANKKYGKYVLDLAGDEWDSEKGAWKSEDGRYATALASYDFDGKKASYNAAQAAYYVAYQVYTEQSTELSNQWTTYVNGLMSQASIQVGTLVS